MSRLAVVIIGRNEGERLRRCLQSVVGRAACVVYVDSGSSDDSVAVARAMGVDVVDLDMSVPFTAARARNEGFGRALTLDDRLDYVQFVDGDCEVIDGWLEAAAKHLEEHAQVSVVAGRLRERCRGATIYNRLCDMEWNAGVGEVAATGGIMMVRVTDFRAIGGFNAALIAGEEPDLCARLRQRGRVIRRLSDDMAWHDAAMTRFGQWWRRAERGGHAIAEEAALHGESRAWRQVASNFIAGLLLPLVVIVLAPLTWGLSCAAAIAAAGLWSLRIALARGRREGENWGDRLLYGIFCLLSKIPQALGQMRYWANRLLGRRSAIIEYKGTASAADRSAPSSDAGTQWRGAP